MTQRKLQQIVNKWQAILRLQDWEVEAVAVQAEYTDLIDGNTGLCERRTNHHIARITIAVKQSAEKVEEDVLHELLHVKLAPLWALHLNLRSLLGSSAQELATSCWTDTEEPFINDLVQALLGVHGYGC